MSEASPQLSALISRLERASGPDRELDARIWAEIDDRDVRQEDDWLLAQSRRMPWDECRLGVFENGRFLTAGQEPPFPSYTSSLDAAVTLVPEGWFWRVGRTSLFRAWAGVHQTHPDHGEEDHNEFFWSREYWESPSTPVIALCIAALRAVHAQTPPHVGKSIIYRRT